ncbi:hypothetical protein HMPREF1870_00933 [Bacteroidales bacterium KA00344]|nr:hypothetical protein HMPREF1870_00933 [Bacteroidales bacterium KA00344]
MRLYASMLIVKITVLLRFILYESLLHLYIKVLAAKDQEMRVRLFRE